MCWWTSEEARGGRGRVALLSPSAAPGASQYTGRISELPYYKSSLLNIVKRARCGTRTSHRCYRKPIYLSIEKKIRARRG